MASLNKVLLIGNLTRDPEVKMLSSGRPVCNFGLALNRNFKDSEGNKREEVTFIEVECFGPRAEAVGRFFTKGRSIFVEGRLKLDQWESKEGEKRSAQRPPLPLTKLYLRQNLIWTKTYLFNPPPNYYNGSNRNFTLRKSRQPRN